MVLSLHADDHGGRMMRRGMPNVEVFNDWALSASAHTSLLPPVLEMSQLREAYCFAEFYHRGQTRPTGEPYILHLVEVVEILNRALGIADTDLLSAGLLHDVVDDSDCTHHEVSERFGERIGALVQSAATSVTTHRDCGNSTSRNPLGQLSDVPTEVLLLKLADRYSVVQRIHTHPGIAKQRSYYRETVEYFAPFSRVHDRVAEIFAAWLEAYDYLDGPVDTVSAAEKLAASYYSEDNVSRTSITSQTPATTIQAESLVQREIAEILLGAVGETSCTLDHLRGHQVPEEIIDLIKANQRGPQ